MPTAPGAALDGPLSGAWRCTAGACASVRTDDGTDAPRIAAATASDPAAALVLDGPTTPPDLSTAYGLRFDFRRDPAHGAGHSVGARHTSADGSRCFWSVEFLAGHPTVTFSVADASGALKVVATGDLTLKGKHDADKTWYRVELRNEPGQVGCRITCRDFAGHVPPSGSTDDFLFDQHANHAHPTQAQSDGSANATAAPGQLSIFVSTAGAAKPDLAGLISTVIATDPLVPLVRPPATVKQATVALSSSTLQLLRTPGGDLLLAPAGGQPLAHVSLAAEVPSDHGTMVAASVKPAPAEPVALSASSFSAQFQVLMPSDGDAADAVCATATVTFSLVERTQTDRQQLWEAASFSPLQSWLEATLAVRSDSAAAIKYLRLSLQARPTTAAWEPSTTRRIAFAKLASMITFEVDNAVDPVEPVVKLNYGPQHFIMTPSERAHCTVDSESGCVLPQACKNYFGRPSYQYPWPVDAYVPLVCHYGTDAACPGIALSADQRCAFTLEAGLAQLSASRLFFFKSPGAEDAGLHNGDVHTTCKIVILSRFVALSVSLIQKVSLFQTPCG